ncbi:unnamed protein product [Spirodela intermedia]|uniref:Uncharacterized protein n=1 Tax=Spirodela intermedia TaxID=51605 RepID=A0A7I8IL58_SPIIN|nr:unnamed protein product [Spirodela intermedia]CAA6658651.1 unnamed protein product [Spirodela intermedia]
MGNSIGRKRTAKVMKVDGSTTNVRPPATARESEQVKQLGFQAQPLDLEAPLKPGKLYFLFELPKAPPAAARGPARRVKSAIAGISAADRLEGLKLTRRSSSDVSYFPVAASSAAADDGGARRTVRIRLPKAEVARLIEESRDAAEAAQKMMELVGAASGSSSSSGELRDEEGGSRRPSHRFYSVLVVDCCSSALEYSNQRHRIKDWRFFLLFLLQSHKRTRFMEPPLDDDRRAS